MPESFTSLEQQLAASGNNYLLAAPLSDEHAHIYFKGRFMGRDVIWDAHIHSLASIARKISSPEQKVSLKQFIEISVPANDCHEQIAGIRIGLNLPVINHANILKTIIMVHNYKNLHTGRHEYGPPVEFDLSNN